MSLVRDYHLICDGCSREQQGVHSTPTAAREEAYRVGWRRVITGIVGEYVQKADLCPSCYRAREEGYRARQATLDEELAAVAAS